MLDLTFSRFPCLDLEFVPVLELNLDSSNEITKSVHLQNSLSTK